MSTGKTLSLCAMAALAGMPVSAFGQIRGIFCNNAASSNSAVPTIGGTFVTGVGSASAFDRPFLSPDGARWIIAAIKEDAADDKEILVVGSGQTGAGAITVIVEDAITAFDAARTYAALDQQMGINNAGQYAFTCDLDGATTDDETLVLFNGTTHVAAAREGAVSPISGQNFGSIIDSAHILGKGTPRYRAQLSPTTTKMINASGASTIIAETDVTTPTGQLVAPDQSLDILNTNRFVSSSDGLHSMWVGDLNGPTTTDLVMVVDGAVKAQEGVPLPGNAYPGVNVSTLFSDTGSQQMASGGAQWVFRAVMADTIDIVLKNGAVIAKTDDPITPSSTELWDDVVFAVTFFSNAVNNNGDMVIGGVTNNPNVNLDGVKVYHPAGGTPRVLVREGDAIDLDGNGVLDDDAFIDIMGNDDGVLSDDGMYYFVASIQNAANTSTGNAFLVMSVNPPPGCYANCDGSTGTPALTGNDFVCFINAFANGDSYANCDGSTGSPALTGNDFVCFINAFAQGCS